MSAREWLPPCARFIGCDAEIDLDLEMRANRALEDTWRACMAIYQDGDGYEVVWSAFVVGVHRVPA